MRKPIFALVLCLALLLCGCSAIGLSTITPPETLKNWSFQYNEGTDDYSVFFALLDKQGKYMAYDVSVDIKILDENENELYSDKKAVTESDFGYYTSTAQGEQYLANIRIPASEIQSGTSNCGTVYLKVYKENAVDFGEVNCHALYCLPVKDISVAAVSLPTELTVTGFDGSTESIIRVDDVSTNFDKDLMSLTITVAGEKTYGGSNAGYDIFTCKIYDKEGYLVQTQDIFLYSLSSGDKFKDDSFVVYDVVPGESYTIQLQNYAW